MSSASQTEQAKIRASHESEIRACRSDFPYYANKYLRIVSKAGGVVKFRMNRAQRWVHQELESQRQKTGKVRAIILKGRQQGMSTYIAGRFHHGVTFRTGVNAFILSHASDTTAKLFQMTYRMHKNMSVPLIHSTETANRNELRFAGLDSTYYVGTAGTKEVGRGGTIHYFHGSEVAFWPNAENHMAGILQSIPTGRNSAGTESILESTGNGVGNVFHAKWDIAMRGGGEYMALFVPWWWQAEYRDTPPDGWEPDASSREYMDRTGIDREQAYWMELKKDELVYESKFHREYPSCPEDAFRSGSEDSLISSEVVLDARIQKDFLTAEGPVIIGVDPARSKNLDSTAIAVRQGRVVHDVEQFRSKDLAVIADRVAELVHKWDADKVFVDVGGVGAGVFDILKRYMGYARIATQVQFGGGATDKDRYRNKREEMYYRMKEWFENGPVQIPNIDVLHGDLVAVRFIEDKDRLEQKHEMKSRGVSSPDTADAVALTFAYNVANTRRNHSPLKPKTEYDVFAV